MLRLEVLFPPGLSPISHTPFPHKGLGSTAISASCVLLLATVSRYSTCRYMGHDGLVPLLDQGTWFSRSCTEFLTHSCWKRLGRRCNTVECPEMIVLDNVDAFQGPAGFLTSPTVR